MGDAARLAKFIDEQFDGDVEMFLAAVRKHVKPTKEQRDRRRREYQRWHQMLQRCENPKSTGYPHYGGRGIKVCSRWQEFENFYRDMGPAPSDGHSIDRIDVDGNYAPKNCRWATADVQAKNTRRVRDRLQRIVNQIDQWQASAK